MGLFPFPEGEERWRDRDVVRPVCSGKPPEMGGSQDWSRVILKLKPVQHPPKHPWYSCTEGAGTTG